MAAIGERRIHAAFEISIVLKGVNALLECVGGVVLWFTSVETLRSIVSWLVHDELLEDPRDLVANYLLHAAEQLSVSGKAFAAFYLFSHGAVKLVLVAGLLRDKRWAYPASLAVIGVFIAYQLYRLTFAWSTGLVLLTIFDFVVVALIWHEYSRIRRHLPRT